jgi:diaminopimelate decarboxylase
MHHFAYRDGVLHAEDVDLRQLADEVGTPFYCYSSATLERHYRVMAEAFAGTDHLICYAMKANSNQAVIKTMAALGAGMDVVSEGELRRALAAGVPARKIVFSGVGKTAREMALALREGIACFNVESEPELELLSVIANRIGQRASVSIRVNPDVDAKTHHKISTGKAEDKFGISYKRAPEVYARAAELPGLDVAGIDMHIGSQITELEPFAQAFRQHPPPRSRRRPWRTLSRHQRRAAASGRICRDGEAHARPPRPQICAGARPHDRRQCRDSGVARHPCEGGRREAFRHPGRGDERPDPADAL